MEFSTAHALRVEGAYSALSELDAESVDLIVTSPPYPMIPMWDECFSSQSHAYALAREDHNGKNMHSLAHGVLGAVWMECVRVLRPGRFLCINIGDAVRTVKDVFQFYSNTTPIYELLEGSLVPLPPIVWRKPSNSPTKFLGSGMLPGGAYVTMEHEHILIFRKGDKRQYPNEAEKNRRYWSALFWEERNRYFSDLWTFPGVRQTTEESRRTGAFPFELPARLISMFSLYSDVVVDPFAGTGTTMCAAMALGRNSIMIERDEKAFVRPEIHDISSLGEERLFKHNEFVEQYKKKETLRPNARIKSLVKSPQEESLRVIDSYSLIYTARNTWEVKHADIEV